MGRPIYCHFSFKRPRDKETKQYLGYGLFAVAFYFDMEGKKQATHITRRFDLWKNHQFVTAIQAYEHALYCIHSFQGQMRESGITEVYLVTDNSTLAGWIENPKKNKAYTAWMNKAVSAYRVGAPKEITLAIGLLDVRDYEKSYKYCYDEYVVNNEESSGVIKDKSTGKRLINLTATNTQYSTITEIENSNSAKPEIEGM